MITSISMYRLMSSSLVALLVLSVVCAWRGLIGYSPAGILGVAAVAVLATAVSTLVFAAIFRQVAHLESSLITGLLIAFIVPPTLAAEDLIGAGLAGMLAGASKYLITIRGRHFLNPAATGTALAVVLGQSFSFWWIANPPMTLALIAAGALIAWRSGLGAIALTGIGVGGSALFSRLVLSGQDPFQSLYLIVTSYPLLFVMLFMLTEPLTQPPRARSRHLVAGLVGLGVALPFSVPLGALTLSSSPELALLAGNTLALAVTLITRSSRAAPLSLIESRELGDYGAVFRFSLARPVRFRAGQWIELHFPHHRADGRGVRRVFSVVSAPHEARGENPTLSIATRLSHPGSSFKHALSGAPTRSAARVSQIGGDFVLPSDTATPLLLIAGGVGITPFLSQLAEDTHHGVTRDVVVIDVRRDSTEAWADDVLQASGATHVITGRDGLDASLDGVVNLTTRWCAVSGSPAFVGAVTSTLRRRGVTTVAKDSFLGY